MVIFHSCVSLPEEKNEDNRTFQICRTHLYRIPNARHTSLGVAGEQSDLHEEITKHKKSLGASSLTTTNKIQQTLISIIGGSPLGVLLNRLPSCCSCVVDVSINAGRPEHHCQLSDFACSWNPIVFLWKPIGWQRWDTFQFDELWF
jgi:hypothetical protein